jgi:NADPH:quinone reductase-like Zn-dependent oxidoreductase
MIREAAMFGWTKVWMNPLLWATLRDQTTPISIKCSVQSRYVTMSPQLLIPIPSMLDAGEAVTLVSTYLPAFGALHHGNSKREKRFSRKALKGSNILITAGGTTEADAVVKLALLGGASKVFVLASEKTKTTYHVGSHRVLALNEDPAVWLPRLQGQIDVVIDVAYPKNFEALKSSLTTTGRYVAVVPSGENNNYVSSFVRTALFATNGVLLYDFDEICENCYEDVLVSKVMSQEVYARSRV